jgi:hypothetical protein
MAGLPKAMLKKREEIKAQNPELVNTEQPQKIMIPIDPPAQEKNSESLPVVEQPVEEKKLSQDEEWKSRAEQIEQKYRSLEGVIASLEPKYTSEREKVSRLEQELAKLREAMPQPEVKPDPSEELTEEEMQTYGVSAPVIQKIAKKIAKGELSSALKELRKEISELREANTRVQTDLTQTSEQQFLAHVKSVINNFDSVTSSKEWSEYLSERVPYSRKNIYDSLTEAHKERDLDTIKEIFAGFKPKKSALAAMTSPSLNGGSTPVNTNGQQKPMLKWSDRKKISEDFRMGRIPLAKKNEWDKLFKEAEADNRIDYQH